MGLLDGVKGLVEQHPVETAIGAGVIGIGAGAGVASLLGKSSKRKTRKSRKKRGRIVHTKRGWKQDRKRKSKQSWEVAYRKRKKRKSNSSRSRRGIKYTKNGQPYKIMANGRARFIKKKRR